MTTNVKAQSAMDLENEATKLLQFIPCHYTSGPSKALHVGSQLPFLNGLMRNSRQKANASRVTEGLNAAAIFGFVSISGAKNQVQAMAHIYKKLSDDPIEICETAASFILLDFNINEFESLDSNTEIFFRIARMERRFFVKMYEQLEIARKV